MGNSRLVALKTEDSSFWELSSVLFFSGSFLNSSRKEEIMAQKGQENLSGLSRQVKDLSEKYNRDWNGLVALHNEGKLSPGEDCAFSIARGVALIHGATTL